MSWLNVLTRVHDLEPATQAHQHLDHSCVSRSEYDEALRSLGHWRWRARDAERQLAELRKEAA